MAKFSQRSKTNLNECHKDLQHVLNYCIRYFDFSVIEGHRPKEEQNKAFAEGKSKLKYPKSKHNSKPSMAADAVPYPIDWKDVNRMRYFAGYVVAVGRMMYDMGATEHLVRTGFDWDDDTELKDTRFQDGPHFELYKVKP